MLSYIYKCQGEENKEALDRQINRQIDRYIVYMQEAERDRGIHVDQPAPGAAGGPWGQYPM